jgi:D-alanyl-D-alanine carboxypeptidase/D-alanyl-D-alanine-endopeptidase (penicillin-binding protein 4)
MKKVCLLCMFSVGCMLSIAQTVAEKLGAALSSLEKDEQMQAAIISLYVVESNTGVVIYEKNSRYGLAPASTQKLFTSAAALDLLTTKFKYTTNITLYGSKGTVNRSGYLEINGTGDPSLGSWRFAETKKEKLIRDWTTSLSSAASGIAIKGIYVGDIAKVNQLTIPDGYIWQDIGNYYGAGSSLVNWNENQYDLTFRSGGTGMPTSIVKIEPAQQQLLFVNTVTGGAAGSGDNAFIYAAPFSNEAIIRGTIPPSQTGFSISGAMPDAGYTLGSTLRDALSKAGVMVDSGVHSSRRLELADSIKKASQVVVTLSHQSPTLDTLVYWFLRKSINLYGEAFTKTVGKELTGTFDHEAGLKAIKNFWKSKGIATSGMQLYDGSGLSPQNRVTTKALAQVLQYAAGQGWYPAFYNALPEYNGMKMKSGSINGARAYAGYHTSRNGKKYTFAIIINNYEGSASAAVRKMYRVLDLLK